MTPATRFVRFAGIAAAGFLFAACGADPGTAPGSAATPAAMASALVPVPGRYVVIMQPGEQGRLAMATAAMADQLETSLPEAGIAVMRNMTPAQVSAVAARAGVQEVVQDMSAQWLAPETFNVLGSDAAAEGSNQSGAQLFSLQWNVQVIQGPAGWAATPGGAGTRVCILDTGIDPTHIELANKVDVAASRNTNTSFPGNQLPWDYNAHGTFVASQVSTNGLRIASVAPDARICAIKVLGVTGSGSFGDIISGIQAAATDYHANVINMSLGAYIDKEAPGANALIRALQAAIDFAVKRGIPVVVSSGNNGVNLDEDAKNLLAIPAQLKNVISVGATAPFQLQNFDMLASYSAYGGRTGIDLVAPGGDLLPGGDQFDLVIGACSTFAGLGCLTSDLLIGSGTSFASPVVAGAAAVLKSKFGNLKPSTIERCLVQGADVVGPSNIFGAGRLNVLKASSCDP